MSDTEKLDHGIPFEEGEYLVEQAFLVAPDHSAILLENAVIRVTEGPAGRRRINGWARIRNVLLVDMMDDHDRIDLILDLGGEFKYLMRDPELKSGKVFSPHVKSTIQFSPRRSWERMGPDEYESFCSRLKPLSC